MQTKKVTVFFISDSATLYAAGCCSCKAFIIKPSLIFRKDQNVRDFAYVCLYIALFQRPSCLFHTKIPKTIKFIENNLLNLDRYKEKIQ